MKKIVIVSLMISTLLFLTSCASKAQKSKKVEEKHMYKGYANMISDIEETYKINIII